MVILEFLVTVVQVYQVIQVSPVILALLDILVFQASPVSQDSLVTPASLVIVDILV